MRKIKVFSVSVCIMLLYSCEIDNNSEELQVKSELYDRKDKIEEMEVAVLKQDQIDRKIKSNQYCLKYNIPNIETLPAISSEADVKIRDLNSVIERTLVICYLGLKSEGLEQSELDRFEEKYQIQTEFTINEKLYKNAVSPTEQQIIDANWKYEGMHILLWSLGYIDSLSYPSEMCKVGEDVKHIFSRTKEEFMNDSKMRSSAEILDQADLIYKIDWACVNARVNNEDAPASLDAGIVYERHFTLNWLINYMNQDWDNVTTDT